MDMKQWGRNLLLDGDTLNHIWNDHNDKKQQWDDVCHDMMEKIEDKLKNLKAPLGLYFWNPTSHICCYDKYKFAEHGFDYWRRGGLILIVQ